MILFVTLQVEDSDAKLLELLEKLDKATKWRAVNKDKKLVELVSNHLISKSFRDQIWYCFLSDPVPELPI